MRVACSADLHVREGDEERVRSLFGDVASRADALVLAGDLTDHGRQGEAEVLLRGLRDVGVPVLAVLGNHDHESGAAPDLVRILASGGIRVIDRAAAQIGEVGFAGAKGFGGGFGTRTVRAFGEEAVKAFVTESVLEAEGLRSALLSLPSARKMAILHYAPVEETLHGEPLDIHPFLGSSRLGAALEEGGAQVAVHGHAHHGRMQGKTERGVPVYNVSLPVLKAAGHPDPYLVLTV